MSTETIDFSNDTELFEETMMSEGVQPLSEFLVLDEPDLTTEMYSVVPVQNGRSFPLNNQIIKGLDLINRSI